MNSKLCVSLAVLYREIMTLQKEFLSAVEKNKKSRNFEQARQLREEILNRAEKIRNRTRITPELAREIFGEDFLGPEEFKKAFDAKPMRETPIPFSPRRLERAREEGFCLIYRPEVCVVEGLTPQMNIETIQALVNRRLSQEAVPPDRAKQVTDALLEQFILAGLGRRQVREGWALVSRKTLPGTEDKNYLEQTDILAKYLEKKMLAKELGMQSHPFRQGAALAEYLEKRGD